MTFDMVQVRSRKSSKGEEGTGVSESMSSEDIDVVSKLSELEIGGSQPGTVDSRLMFSSSDSSSSDSFSSREGCGGAWLGE